MVFRAEIVVFGGFDLMLMDIRTYGHTDGPSHRDARTHLKSRIMIIVRLIWNHVAAVNQTEENTASAEKYFLYIPFDAMWCHYGNRYWLFTFQMEAVPEN